MYLKMFPLCFFLQDTHQNICIPCNEKYTIIQGKAKNSKYKYTTITH